MKKQILFLVLFVVAVVAGVNKSYGQLAPQAVTCLVADALHPVAGTPYTYSITVPAIVGTKAYTWFVTQEKNLITGSTLTGTRETNAGTGAHVLTSGAGYNDPGTASNTISITWKSFTYDATNPVFVVIQVTNDDGAGCTTQNMKVYEIVPQKAFTLDIDNLTAAGAQVTPLVYGDNINTCMPNIISATWNVASPTGITYNYGTNTFLYEVVAANFLTAWNPSVQLTGVNTKETVTVEWSKDKTFATGVVTMAGSTVGTAAVPEVYTSATDVTQTAGVNGFVGSAGESIFIRVTLDHSTATLSYEGDAIQPFTVAIDGITVPVSGVPEADVHHTGGVGVCAVADGFTNDVATQTLLPRPAITSTTVGVAPNPNPGNFLLVLP